jgi:hemolysin activation/secretion protein
MSLQRPAKPTFAFAFLMLASACAFAQVRPDAGQILEQQREPVRVPPPVQTDVRPKAVPDPKPALPASPQLRVTVKGFTFTGNTIYSDAQLQPLMQEFIGKELNFDGLIEAATKVRAHYRERGYFLAQTYLPQQAIRDGVVEIGVIEGRLGEVEVERKPASRLSNRLLNGIVHAHLRTGDIITETGLEKPLLLINDLPTASVTSEIRPSRAIGAADVKVNVDRGVGLFNGFVDLDNHGNRFTGEYRLGANLNLNNPTTLGDQASFRGFVTDEGMWYGRLSYLIPVWYYGTRLGVSFSKFEYKLAKDFESLRASGDGTVKSIYGFHPLIRTRNTNLIVQFAYEVKELTDRVELTGGLEERSIDATKLGLVGDFRDGVFGGGLNAWSVNFTQGDLNLSPAALLVADAAPGTGRRTNGTFRKVNYDARRLQKITPNINLLLALNGQAASNNLTSAEKMSLGGPTGVRAYPVGEATGDSAIIFQGEARYLFPNFKVFGGGFTLSGHYDFGWVKVNQDPFPTDRENKRSIAGYGVGASLGNEGNFIVRATASWRQGSELPESDTAKRVPRIWLQAIKWF